MPVGDPKPKNEAKLVPKRSWPARGLIRCDEASSPLSDEFERVLAGRRTVRQLSALTIDDLCVFLYRVRRTLSYQPTSGGRLRKPSLSAGGLHAIDLIVAAGPGLEYPIVFDDVHGCFVEFESTDAMAFSEALWRLRSIVPSANGHLIVYAAHLERLACAYEQFEALALRDAGAIDQLLSMAAYDAGFSFVPLGSNGDDAVQALSAEGMHLAGVGSGVLGRPRSQD
ncbi:MAG: hypothetical protein WDM79_01980 [Terricaulis sp.]